MFALGACNILSALLIYFSPAPPKAPKIDLLLLPNTHPAVPSASNPVILPAPVATLECKPYNEGFPRFIDPLTVTIRDLNSYLSNNTITSELLVAEYLSRIQHLDRSSPVDPDSPYPLNSVIETIPLDVVLPIARHLDGLRKNGTILSHLHGIPILVKDNIATDVRLGMNTTAGSLALLPENAGTVPSDADVIQNLRKMGAIIIGKANMSEWAGARGDNSTSESDETEKHSKRPDRKDVKKSPEYVNGWSARGGQTYSAYIPRGNPSGSSSGSAVAVAAGFAPVSLGTDTDGSITGPASKASLYAIKPTVGLASRKGIVPWSRSQDTAGAMAKSAWDVAAVLDAIVLNVDDDDDDYEEEDEDWEEVECLQWLKSKEGNKRKNYVESAEYGERIGFKGIGIGVMNPEFWISDLFTGGRGEEALDALNTLESLGARVIFDNISVPSIPELISTSNGNESIVLQYERKRDIEAYLSSLVWPPKGSHAHKTLNRNYDSDAGKPPLRTLQSIVTFNAEHSKAELAAVHCCQQGFIDSLNVTISSNSSSSVSSDPVASNRFSPSDYEKYQSALYWNRHYGRTIGLDAVFNSNPEIDALAIPSDGASSILPSLSGYPIATVPLGVDMTTGEPFGLSFIGRRFSEGTLIRIMAAYEQMMKERGGRRVPKNMC